MKLFKLIINEFLYQSSHYQSNSRSVRLKRIQTIFKNAFLLISCLFSYVTMRAIILFVEPSSFGTTLSFAIFLPLMAITNFFLALYIKSNPISKRKEKKIPLHVLSSYENNIGFYSSLLSFWVITLIPLTIYYENEKFDKGIQFMMSKIFINFADLILMQPKSHAQFCEIVFTLIYFAILSLKCFSFVNLFFASAASVSTFFIFYIADQLSNDYNNLLKKKENMLKLNSEVFKMIKEPVLIIYSSLCGIVFKNYAFEEIEKTLECKNEIHLLKLLQDDNNVSINDMLHNEEKNNHQNILNKEISSVYSYNPTKKQDHKYTYHVKYVRKKMKHIKEEVIAIYFHDIGNEMDIKILEKNIDFTNLMLYSLSHEVRTPLNGMQGILELIKGRVESYYNDQIKIALGCSDFLVSQINCMLDYSQIIKKEFKVHFENINIRSYMKKLRKVAKTCLVTKKSSVNLELSIGHDVPEWFIFDPERIKQVLLNLITNSVKYTNMGSIILGATLISNEELSIFISDTGSGFTEEQVNSFNELQTKNLIKYDRGKKGFPGYKLSICQLLIKKLKSKLVLFSEKAKGAKFIFKLCPNKLKNNIEFDIYKRTKSGTLIDGESTPTSNMEKYAIISTKKTLTNINQKFYHRNYTIESSIKWIIVADDVELNRFVISGMAKKLNFNHVLEASNGKEALDLAFEKTSKKEEYLIFMDIDMPVLNGLESTKLIRKFSSHPIIAVTAFIGEEMRKKAKEVGMNKFLTKPISISKIKAILKEYNYI